MIGDDTRAVEVQVETIAGQIIGYLNANPYLVIPSAPGGTTVTGIVQGIADNPILAGIPEPAVNAIMLLQISVEGTF
jgi:hypothetical protein